MRTIHYSTAHLTEVRSVSQGEDVVRSLSDKPNGLWVSVEGEDDWPTWCEAEAFALESLTHPTEIVLRNDANVLVVNGEDRLRSFHAEYQKPHPLYDKGFKWYGLRSVIDWEAVAGRYQGIIIAPYVWACRLDMAMMWYYSWDCASGAIWDASAVLDLRPLAVRTPETVRHSAT